MRKLENILILAGGDNTRFWPLEDKVFFPFIGKPLLDHLTESVKKYGQNIFIVIDKKSQDRSKILSNKNQLQICTQDSKLSGMAGAIDSVRNKIKGECLILNASDIFDYSVLLKYIEIVIKKKPDMILLGKIMNDYFPGGYFRFHQNRLVEIIEKPGDHNTPSNQVRMVVDYFSNISVLFKAQAAVKTDRDDHYEQAISYLLKNGSRVETITYDNYWYPLKYPWQVLTANNFFLESIGKNKIEKTVKVSSSAKIIGPVYFANNVKIGDFCKIVGPTFIGENSIVADHTLVNKSYIGKSCLIGGYSEVTRSYLANQVMLHRNYVGDAILSDGVLMGAGANTANFRFDGQPIKNTGMIKLGAVIGRATKIGVNATLLPGINIGKNCLVGPGEVICADIPDKIFYFKGKIKKNKI